MADARGTPDGEDLRGTGARMPAPKRLEDSLAALGPVSFVDVPPNFSNVRFSNSGSP
jgi:hypothetical protein